MSVQAPFGRRLVPVTGIDDVGAYRVLHAADLDGPRRGRASSTCSPPRERWGGGADERPYLPRAFSFLGAADGQLSFMLEDVGPGTRRLCELRAGDELWLAGPLGSGFERAARRPARDPRRRRRRHPAAGGVVGRARRARRRGDRGARLPRRAPCRGRAPCCGRGPRIATDDGSVGHHGLVTDLLAARAGRATTTPSSTRAGRPRMLEAVRALCAARGVPAQLALESGMACGFGACFGCVVAMRDGGYVRVCVDGPVLDADRLDLVPAH